MPRSGQAAANAPMPKQQVSESDESEVTFATISYALQDVFDLKALIATARKLQEGGLLASVKTPEKYGATKLRSLLLHRVEQLRDTEPVLLNKVKSSVDAVARAELHKR